MQVAVDVEPEEITGIVGRPAEEGTARWKPSATRSSEVTKASMERTGLSVLT